MSGKRLTQSERHRRFFSLRLKTLLIVLATLACLFVALFFSLRTVLLASFARLEEQTVRTDAARARDALLTNLAAVDRTAKDYGYWDDTYEFVQHPNQAYIDECASDSVFTSNRLSLVEWVSATGQVVLARSFDLESEQEVPVPEAFLQPATYLAPLLSHPTTTSSITGFVLLPDAPLLVASEPILTNDAEGPIPGTLLMGLSLNAFELHRLTETAHMKISVVRLDAPSLPPDARTAAEALNAESGAATFVQRLDERWVAGYTMFRDVLGEPAFLLRVTQPRTIYAQGLTSVRYLAAAIAIAGLGLGAVMLLLLEWVVLSRLTRLTAVARRIAEGDLDAQARAESADETGVLAETFNAMTSRLGLLLKGEREQREHLQSAVSRYTELLVQVAQGNLGAEVTAEEAHDSADDPLLLLRQHLQDTVSGLQRMIVQVRDAANGLAAASSEILAAATQQASGANEQSVAISQTSSTIDELRVISEQAARRAQGVVDLAQQTEEIARAGQQALAATVSSMGAVKQKVETIASGILSLSEQAQAIGQIVAAVSDIASQSNMLALNAAVEAARAGEAGKGFAVVASEVRTLADQSRAATVQVKDLLSEIQRGVNTAVMLTEEGMKGADAGVRVAGQAGEAIRQLADSVTASVQAAAQIAAAGEQESAGMEEVAQAMQNIQQVTAQALGSMRQLEQQAQALDVLAGKLRQVVEQYRL